MLNTITFPLSEEIFMILDDIDHSKYLVDVSKIDFGEDEDNIESSFIYMRNLQLNMPLDFSKVSYDDKAKWILQYLNLGNYCINIPTLSETILTILADDDLQLQCIFSADEIKKFRNEYKNIVDELLTFIVSLDEIIFLLVVNKENEHLDYNPNDFNIIDTIPEYFNTIIKIINLYPQYIDGIKLFYTEKYNHFLYKHALDFVTSNNELYSSILQLPSTKLLGFVYSF